MATILITGANRGIGLELVRQFLARGDTVLCGVSQGRIKSMTDDRGKQSLALRDPCHRLDLERMEGEEGRAGQGGARRFRAPTEHGVDGYGAQGVQEDLHGSPGRQMVTEQGVGQGVAREQHGPMRVGCVSDYPARVDLQVGQGNDILGKSHAHR